MDDDSIIILTESDQDDMEIIENIFPDNPLSLAEEKKTKGNEHYKAQNYQTALIWYSDAINTCPDIASYYGNRAACYMMLCDYKLALQDSRTAISLDPNFHKGYIRIIKCCLALGDITGAEQAISKLLEIDTNNKSIKTEKQYCSQLRQIEDKIQGLLQTKNHRTVIYLLDNALKISPACNKYKLLKAECLIYLGRMEEANDIAVTVMKIDPASSDAVYIRGLCLYYGDNLEKGLLHFERVLQLDPDHHKAKEMRIKSKKLKEKKEKGNLLFKSGKYQEALNIYTEALEIDPFNSDMNSKLYYNRALVNSKLRNFPNAIDDCTNVLKLKTKYLKALLLRAKCYSDIENYDECVKDYEEALTFEKTTYIRNLLREAKFALKKSKRKDYYKILGINKTASEDEIKKAYKKKALAHHPDRHANSSDIVKKEQELKFKEIGEAYTVLSDSKKKMRHDNGQDMEDEQAEFDPNQMFRHFFGFEGTSFQFEF